MKENINESRKRHINNQTVLNALYTIVPKEEYEKMGRFRKWCLRKLVAFQLGWITK